MPATERSGRPVHHGRPTTKDIKASGLTLLRIFPIPRVGRAVPRVKQTGSPLISLQLHCNRIRPSGLGLSILTYKIRSPIHNKGQIHILSPHLYAVLHRLLI